MASLLALTAAMAYGAGDFLGGVASRRAPTTAVVLWSHVVGLLLMLVAAPLVGGEATARALAVGAGAGLVGAVGVALFYQGLSVGSMSVVAPIAGLLSAAVPVAAGLAIGERPGVAALAGIALALLAITLVSRDAADGDVARTVTADESPAVPRGTPAVQVLALATAAGVAFGLFFVALNGAGDGTGIWPLVGARTASVTLFTILGLAGVTRAAPPREAAGAAIGAGLLDASANVFYLLALSHGLLSVVSVLTALYPAGTVLLARYGLGEHMSAVQRTGLAVAGVSAVLIAV
ncbi:MAG TPA: EamA family transporter [Acidimicrobiales bacterium]